MIAVTCTQDTTRYKTNINNALASISASAHESDKKKRVKQREK